MDNTALFKLSYGVFMLATKSGDKSNGCITNTCMQVSSNPNKIAISVINTNYTCELLKESGQFTLSILDETCSFETIKHFGMQSGRDVDKFSLVKFPTDLNDIPYLGWHTCAVLSAKVTESIDLGSHTLFVAEIVDAVKVNDNAPLTYADYHSKVKPKPEKLDESKKIIGWRCKICKHFYEGETIPTDYICPLCGHEKDDFEPVYE